MGIVERQKDVQQRKKENYSRQKDVLKSFSTSLANPWTAEGFGLPLRPSSAQGRPSESSTQRCNRSGKSDLGTMVLRLGAPRCESMRLPNEQSSYRCDTRFLRILYFWYDAW